jgi:hypothetical protein
MCAHAPAQPDGVADAQQLLGIVPLSSQLQHVAPHEEEGAAGAVLVHLLKMEFCAAEVLQWVLQAL